MASHEPGRVFILPQDEDEKGDPGGHPHVLLTSCTDDIQCVTLAFGTSQTTEADLGAQFIAVKSWSPLFHCTGLSKTTYFYPSRLVFVDPEDLGEPIGRIIDEFPPLLGHRLPLALGNRTGTCRDRGSPAAGSARGVIVQLSPRGRAVVNAEFALVVAEPAYSQRLTFWNVIPILNGAEYEEQPPFVLVGEEDWVREMGYRSALLLVPAAQAVFVRDHVSRPLKFQADEATMIRVDDALRSHFLP